MRPDLDVAVVGSVNVDLVATVAALPLPGETVPALEYAQFLGGKGSNQAIAAARLGRAVAFVGLVGDDREGAAVRASLAGEGVDVTHLEVCVGVPTGRAIVLVDGAAENSIVVVGGANQSVGPRHIEAAGDVVRDARVVVSQLEIPLDAVGAAARACEGTFILNPAPARSLPRELLDLVDVLVVNEVEYEAVTGSVLPEDVDVLEHAVREPGMPPGVVVTLGARGAYVWDGEHVDHVAAPRVKVVDTTGAGDTFIGALADALSRGEELRSAVRWAVHAGAAAVRSLGATTGMPTPQQVLALTADQHENAPAGEEDVHAPR